MRIEEDIFRRMSVDFDRLLPFGFQKSEDGFRYSEPFMEGEFQAEIRITKDGAVSGRVMDLASEEEYLPVHIEAHTGAFVGEVRKAYTDILNRIARSCFVKEPFLFPQTNRIAREVKKLWGEDPDYPFEKLPEYGVFRYPGNRKWYGLVMNLRKCLLEGKNDPESPTVEILNLKADSARLEELLALPGIRPGYHMNRANWISILLDGTVPDRLVMELLDGSRKFAMGAAGVRSAAGVTHWIAPANPKFYDIEGAFRREKEILWKQSSKIRVGDIIYMYVAAPVSAVRYKCEAIETDIPYLYQDKNVSMTHIMKIRLLETYDPDFFPFKKLNEIGITTVRGPRTAPPLFLELIEKRKDPHA